MLQTQHEHGEQVALESVTRIGHPARTMGGFGQYADDQALDALPVESGDALEGPIALDQRRDAGDIAALGPPDRDFAGCLRDGQLEPPARESPPSFD